MQIATEARRSCHTPCGGSQEVVSGLVWILETEPCLWEEQQAFFTIELSLQPACSHLWAGQITLSPHGLVVCMAPCSASY